MDSPPSNGVVAHDALPDELLEFIDEATLLNSESQEIPPPGPAKAAVAAAPAKPVLVERVNVAPPPPIPLPVAPPEDYSLPLSPPAVAATVPATARPAASTASPLPAPNTAPSKVPAATAPPLVLIPTERSSQAPAATHVLTLADLRSPKSNGHGKRPSRSCWSSWKVGRMTPAVPKPLGRRSRRRESCAPLRPQRLWNIP